MNKYRFVRIGLAALVVAAIGMAGALHADTGPAATSKGIATVRELGEVFAKVAHDAAPAVVSIGVEQAAPAVYSPFGGMLQQQPPRRGQGSGFVVDSGGVILTNHHVIRDAKHIVVRFKDGRELDAKVVGSDAASDLAVLRVDAKDLPTLQLADSDAVHVGSWVLAIGNPFGLGETVTAGIVSATGRNQVGIAAHENFIQTDAAINPGNSGGPLLDVEGRVVGINSAIYSRSGGNMGIGFAIPANLVRNVKDQILSHGSVQRGFLGVVVQPVDQAMAESFGRDHSGGALVAEVSPGSPADVAGLKAGDIVVSVDGRAVDNPGGLRNLVALRHPGARVPLTVFRDGERLELTVIIGSRNGAAVDEQDLGLTLAANGDELVIRGVRPGSPAAKAGLVPGMRILEVNRKAVGTLRDYRKALSGASDHVLLRVDDGSGARYITIEME
jgi:serine protease Do